MHHPPRTASDFSNTKRFMACLPVRYGILATFDRTTNGSSTAWSGLQLTARAPAPRSITAGWRALVPSSMGHGPGTANGLSMWGEKDEGVVILTVQGWNP
jgi:hypothetical protein